jgi:hypothetical protein
MLMNPQLDHTVAFTRMADELRAAERNRRFGRRRPRQRLRLRAA